MGNSKTLKALFINSGILGHKSVFNLLREAVDADKEIAATHIDLSDGLTTRDKIIRRLLCFQVLRGTRVAVSNLDLARWRQEFHAGLLAARRIRACERVGKRFDVLHFHTQATAYMSLARMKRTPSIVSIDCTQTLASREMSSTLARQTYRPNVFHDGLVFRRAAAIISISEWAARDLRATYTDCAEKVLVMPYPVRLKSFDPRWVEERYEKASGADAAPVRVLFMGGDFIRKGGPELLAAWRAGRFETRAVLDLVTDWPINASDLPPGVRLVKNIRPFTPAWSELWRRADVFVMPTRSEAFGMVYQEAGAAGLPAIGTRINAVPEIIEDNVTGLLTSKGNTAELIEAMKALIASAELRRKLGAAARRKIETDCAPEKYSEKLTSLIKRLAQPDASSINSEGAYITHTEAASS